MPSTLYDQNGIRFEYPAEWEFDVAEDGPRSTVSIQSPNGPAFGLITVDRDRPSPKEVVAEALAALKEEYPELEASASDETIDGHTTIGFDIGFFTLDTTNSCAIRCFRTPRRTVFVMAQWTDLDDDDDVEEIFQSVRTSLMETDS